MALDTPASRAMASMLAPAKPSRKKTLAAAFSMAARLGDIGGRTVPGWAQAKASTGAAKACFLAFIALLLRNNFALTRTEEGDRLRAQTKPYGLVLQ